METLTLLVEDDDDSGRIVPVDERATAFEVWLTSGRPKIAKLAESLRQEPYSLDVPYSTLTYWYRTDQWDVEGDRRVAQMAPNLTVRSATHVVSAGVKAAAYVDQVWSGVEPYDRDKMTSALQTLDRAGFGANVKERPRAEMPNQVDDGVVAVAASSLTRDELIERERQRRQRRSRSE